MPVIGIPIDMLESCLGMELDRETLVQHLLHLGCDVEGFAVLTRFKCGKCGHISEITETQDPPVECPGCGFDFRGDESQRTLVGESDVIRMELLAVRPDIFDPGGLARALRAYLGKEPGLKKYVFEEPRLAVEVESATQGKLCPRPAISAAVVKNVKLNDDLIKAVMKLQENLHWALGRDRKHGSIGVYDLDTIKGPVKYKGADPDGMKFVPLGFSRDDEGALMTLRDILEKHPKGTAFKHLLDGFELFPLLEDATGAALSMPPIINSESTKVQDSTSSFFIDVTGSNRDLTNKALCILVTSLKEIQKDIVVERVLVKYPGDEIITPDMTPQIVMLDAYDTSRLIGVDITKEETCGLLQRMAHGTSFTENGSIEVEVPAYRTDILHPRDLMEDVAIAYGYHNIKPLLVDTMTIGRAHPTEEIAGVIRQCMLGLGCLEAMTLALTSAQKSFDRMNLEFDERSVLLAHPISTEQTQLRVSILPGLLETLSANTHRELPQKLFEIGLVTYLDDSSETGAVERLFLTMVLIDARAGAAEARSTCESALRELGVQVAIRNGARGCYMEGRCGEIVVDGRVCGTLGEINPLVLERFDLAHPVAAFEIDVTQMLNLNG